MPGLQQASFHARRLRENDSMEAVTGGARNADKSAVTGLKSYPNVLTGCSGEGHNHWRCKCHEAGPVTPEAADHKKRPAGSKFCPWPRNPAFTAKEKEFQALRLS